MYVFIIGYTLDSNQASPGDVGTVCCLSSGQVLFDFAVPKYKKEKRKDRRHFISVVSS